MMQRIKDSLRKSSSRESSLDSTTSSPTTSLGPKNQQVPSSPSNHPHHHHHGHHSHLLASASLNSAPGIPSGSFSSSLVSTSSTSTLSLTSERRDEVTFETVRMVPRSARSVEITTTPESDDSQCHNFCPSTCFSSSSPSSLHPTTPIGSDQTGSYHSSPFHLSTSNQSSSTLDVTNQFLSTNSPNRSGRSRSFDSAAAAAAAAAAASTASASGSSEGSSGHRKGYTKTSSTFLELPKWKMLVRNKNSSSSSSSSAPYERDCVHCMLMQEISKTTTLTVPTVPSSYICTSYYGGNSSGMLSGNTSTSCSPPPSSSPSVSSEGSIVEDSDSESMGLRTGSLGQSESLEDEVLSEILDSSNLPTVTLSLAPEISIIETEEDSGLTVISLEVPVLPKSGRSASVDSSYLQVPQRTDIGIGEIPPVKAQRSRSVDVALPVGPNGPYIVVPMEKPLPIIRQ